MKQHETHSRTGTIQVLLRACWQGFRTITMCRRRGASPAAAGPGRSAGGRRRGLAGLRADAPSRRLAARTASRRAATHQHTQRPERASAALQAPPVWRMPVGPEGQGGPRDRPLRAAGSRVAISRAAGPTGTRNVSGTTRNAGNPATYSTGAQARRPAPPNATTQTQLRSACVRCRSARAARRSRRSSRSPRLRRRAGPRR